MNISRLFSTKERVELIKHVINLERKFGVNETAKRVRLSKGFVSKYFDILVEENVLRKKGTKFIVTNHSVVKGIRIMLNLQMIDPKIFRKYRFVRAAGLYGSCSKGTNTVDSDVDLWIKVDKASDEDLSYLTAELRKKIENLKILILNDEKIKNLRGKDPLFYHSLYFGSIVLYGEEDEI